MSSCCAYLVPGTASTEPGPLPLPTHAGMSRNEAAEKSSVYTAILFPPISPTSSATEACFQMLAFSFNTLSPHFFYYSHYKEVTPYSPYSQLLCSRSQFTLPPAVHKGATFPPSLSTSLSSRNLTISRDPDLHLESVLQAL